MVRVIQDSCCALPEGCAVRDSQTLVFKQTTQIKILTLVPNLKVFWQKTSSVSFSFSFCLKWFLLQWMFLRGKKRKKRMQSRGISLFCHSWWESVSIQLCSDFIGICVVVSVKCDAWKIFLFVMSCSTPCCSQQSSIKFWQMSHFWLCPPNMCKGSAVRKHSVRLKIKVPYVEASFKSVHC